MSLIASRNHSCRDIATISDNRFDRIPFMSERLCGRLIGEAYDLLISSLKRDAHHLALSKPRDSICVRLSRLKSLMAADLIQNGENQLTEQFDVALRRRPATAVRLLREGTGLSTGRADARRRVAPRAQRRNK